MAYDLPLRVGPPDHDPTMQVMQLLKEFADTMAEQKQPKRIDLVMHAIEVIGVGDALGSAARNLRLKLTDELETLLQNDLDKVEDEKQRRIMELEAELKEAKEILAALRSDLSAAFATGKNLKAMCEHVVVVINGAEAALEAQSSKAPTMWDLFDRAVEAKKHADEPGDIVIRSTKAVPK